jgi:hypothetical protein
MSESIPSSLAVEDSQFDHSQRNGYICDTSPEQSEDSSDEDDDIHSEDLEANFARVEDEDWEIAERGRETCPTRS